VREALRRLTAEGLVRYERNRGVQVQVWSVRDLDEIFSLWRVPGERAPHQLHLCPRRPRGGSPTARAQTSTPEALRRSLAHHHELVAALTARDPEWAESVMRSHVRAAWHSIRTDDAPGDAAPPR
jgi:DNA-binding GntR family transcriptional regulator